jgi:transcriptional regulator with XRE-family HTH domain
LLDERHPSTTDAPTRRRSFCARLKSERERRGTALSAIAETTKVKASLLEGLERGDLSRWPKGLYRRAFFRDYLHEIGLTVDEHVAEFLELFPDGEEHPTAPAPPVPLRDASAPLRIMFAGERPRWTRGAAAPRLPARQVLRGQALAAAVDLAIVGAIALLVSALSPAGMWPAAAVVACAYYAVGTVLLGRTPASWWLGRAAAHLAAPPAPLVIDFSSTLETTADLGLPRRSIARSASALRSDLSAAAWRSPSRTRALQGDLAEVRRRRLENAQRDEISGAIS